MVLVTETKLKGRIEFKLCKVRGITSVVGTG